MKTKWYIILFVLVLQSVGMQAQNYTQLWKQADEVSKKDLPQSELKIVGQIINKAEKERVYGQLLKSELRWMQLRNIISPDSLAPDVNRMVQKEHNCKDEVLRAVYDAILVKIYNNFPNLDENKSIETYRKQALQPIEKLAKTQALIYEPMMLKGHNSDIYNGDLLSVMGYAMNTYEPLSKYYVKAGMRRAACISSLEWLKQQFHNKKPADDWHKSAYVRQLDSLIRVYGDLEEAGEIAVERYFALSRCKNTKVEERITYIHEATTKWGTWQRMNALRMEEQNLTTSKYQVRFPSSTMMTGDSTRIQLKDLRNVSQVTVSVYPVKVNGDTRLNPQNDRDYKQLKSLSTATPIAQIQRNYVVLPTYEVHSDSALLQPLPAGVYLLECQSQPSTRLATELLYVSDLACMQLPQPDNRVRYCVVNAHSGQPVPGAKLQLTSGYAQNAQTVTLTCDEKGEYIYHGDNNMYSVYVYTDADRGYRSMRQYVNDYDAPDSQPDRVMTEIYTDRSIYRPGQTVHVAAIIYRNSQGINNQAVSGKALTARLRDANYQELSTAALTTDEYGMCSTTFTLPSQGLTGNFIVEVGDGQKSIKVEEYKRPTFQLTFPKVEQRYQAGDTLLVKAKAETYAGVPVQGARVKYSVKRTVAFWWFNYARYWNSLYFGNDRTEDEIFTGTATTAEDGSFPVQIPLILPEDDSHSPMFYHYQVTADVTDQAGETHTGEMTVPLGTRASILTADIPQQVLTDSTTAFTFHQRNAAGQDMQAEVRYQIDGGNWQTAQTQAAQDLTKLRSGRHQLKAICGTDTLSLVFVAFSQDDKRPCMDTQDWFYQSAKQFPNDGKPVVIQTGSSAADVHYCYALFSGNKVLEQGGFDKSNALDNRKFTYRDEYGNGLVLVYAWTKNGKSYSHTADIRRPLPDNHLRMKWTTFRDRLTPGQQESWTLNIVGPDGKTAKAQVMSTLYDKSLDQLTKHTWSLAPYRFVDLPNVYWTFRSSNSLQMYGYQQKNGLPWSSLDFNHFNWGLIPSIQMRIRGFGRTMLMAKSANLVGATAVGSFDVRGNDEAAPMNMAMDEMLMAKQPDASTNAENSGKNASKEKEKKEATDQVRENLNETAFFYPDILTDADGNASLRFTLPECLTTWRCMALAHTKDMQVGMLDGEAIAQKNVMVQPNVPRFIRQGDAAQLSTRIFNTTAAATSGQVKMILVNPVTQQTLMEKSQPFTVAAKATANATFIVDAKQIPSDCSLLICKIVAEGANYSDGEQHYLPILPNTERVTVTMPYSQNGAGTKTIDISKYTKYPDNLLTIEYTIHPSWLVLQTLPSVGTAQDDNVISQAVSYYANTLSAAIVKQTPQLRTAFEQWQREKDATSLTSQLQKNQELRDMVLNETPWVQDAQKETEQKQRLSDFFDANGIKYRQTQALTKMKQLQNGDGSWSWWPGMEGSFCLTVEVSRMLARLNTMTGLDNDASAMLAPAMSFMGKEIVKQVEEMKREERRGYRQVFPSHTALEWLYICALDGRKLPASVTDANTYLVSLLKKEIKNQTIYDKALTAIVLHRRGEITRSKEYAQSLKEYTVYTEEMGRYYDTERAYYSWRDYKIPTEVMAMEAIHEILAQDGTTQQEMQRWLLQSKRTQAWDTPVNSADAIYAFLGMPEKGSKPLKLDVSGTNNTVLGLDDNPVAQSAATAAIGYVKTTVPHATAHTFTAKKTTEGTSWGAVYAQFMQPTAEVEAQHAGITVTRKIEAVDINGKTVTIANASTKNQVMTSGNAAAAKTNAAEVNNLKVGDRVKVTITIQADRDYDFVQVADKRAACMEPMNQLSGYHWGYYCAPKDNATYYYFDLLSKGKHTVSTVYYIDRAGTYHTGTCSAQCAYAPEYRALAPSTTLNVK
jgi:sRNA-binding regulator protein Hfq